MELIEQATGKNLIRMQLEACTAMSTGNFPSEYPPNDQGVETLSNGFTSCFAKVIRYHDGNEPISIEQVNDATRWKFPEKNLPQSRQTPNIGEWRNLNSAGDTVRLADIPARNTEVPIGAPVFTVIAQSVDESKATANAKQVAEVILQAIGFGGRKKVDEVAN
jgi:hypothetical protein